MNELLKIEVNEQQEQVISGRALHEFLEIGTAYKDWFPRMCEYGFEPNKDFCPNLSESTGGRPSTDHILKLDMAKELCMLARSEKGKLARQYFIQIEKDWNSPDKLMARALILANNRINTLQLDNAVKQQIIHELQPKATYYDLILQSKSLISISKIAKDYGMSAIKMNQILNELGIQYRQGDIWLLYQKYADKGYTQSKTHIVDNTRSALHTYWTQKGRLFIYDLLKSKLTLLPLIERESGVA